MGIETSILQEVLKLGFSGVVIAVLFLALVRKDKALTEAQDKRANEAEARTEKVLTALNATTVALNKHSESNDALKEIIEQSVIRGPRRNEA